MLLWCFQDARAGSCALRVPRTSPLGSAFAPWRSHLQLCPAFLHPGRARAGFGPVSLGVSLAPGLHWSRVPGNAREGRDEWRCGSHLGAGYFVGVEVPCPDSTPHFLEDISGCSTELWGDQHVLGAHYPSSALGRIASAQLPAVQVGVSWPRCNLPPLTPGPLAPCTA